MRNRLFSEPDCKEHKEITPLNLLLSGPLVNEKRIGEREARTRQNIERRRGEIANGQRIQWSRARESKFIEIVLFMVHSPLRT